MGGFEEGRFNTYVSIHGREISGFSEKDTLERLKKKKEVGGESETVWIVPKKFFWPEVRKKWKKVNGMGDGDLV